MRTMRELITILNECCHYDQPRDKLVFDGKAFEHRVPSKRERAAVMKAIEEEPPRLLPYRDRFCEIEYAGVKQQSIAVVVDNDGKAVLITNGGKIVWEEHNPK